MRTHHRYTTDLTDEQWALLKPFLPARSLRGRPRKAKLRRIVNAVFYVTRNGCLWRDLPHDFPPWQTVYGYFRRWLEDGTWQRMHDSLVKEVRRKEGRKPTPSAAILDSQSVKTTEKGGSEVSMREKGSTEGNGRFWWIRWAF